MISVGNYNKKVFDSFGDKDKDLAIILPPRSGGSTLSLKLGLTTGKTLYLNYRHANIQHAIEILHKLAKTEIKKKNDFFYIVHCVGRSRIDDLSYFIKNELDNIVTETPLIAKGLAFFERKDPYTILIERAEQSNVTLTVPQVAWRELYPDDFDVLVIDEDSTINVFYPSPVVIFKVQWSLTEKGNLESIDKVFSIRKLIDNCPNEIRKEFPEFVKWGLEVEQILSEFWELSKQKKKECSKSPIVVALDEIVDKLPEPPYNDLPFEDRIKIAEGVLSRTYKLEEYDCVELFVASLFFRSYYREQHKHYEKEIYLVPERVLLFKDWLSSFKRIIVRCNDKETAIRFFTAIGRKVGEDVGIWEETDFKYSRNFVVVSSDVKEIARRLYDKGIPFLVLCATKKEAEKAYKWFKKNEMYRVFIADANTPVDKLPKLYNEGYIVIYYQNSSISRGIDLPFYEVVLVWNYGFACPYEEIVDPKSVKEKIIKELEQSILRITPIPGFDENKPRFIVFDNKIPPLKYLQNRIFGKVKPDYLEKILLPFLRSIQRKVATSISNRIGSLQRIKFYGETISNILVVPAQKDTADIGVFLLLTALTHEDPKMAKRAILFSITPDNLKDWFYNIRNNIYKSMGELEENLKRIDNRLRKNELRRWYIKLLRVCKLLKKTEKGVMIAKDIGILKRSEKVVRIDITFPDGSILTITTEDQLTFNIFGIRGDTVATSRESLVQLS